jgi:autotransporter-associated beta strand protein
LKFNRNDAISLDKVISGTGNLIQDGNGTGVLTLTKNNTYTGVTTISSGTLLVGDGGTNGSIATTSAIVDNGTLKFNRSDAIVLGKEISGTGQVIQDGNGTGALTLTADSTYTGNTTVTSGTMIVGDGATNGSITTSANIINNANLTFNRSDATNYTSNLSGNSTANLQQAGSGLLTFSGNGSAYLGNVTLTAGTVSLNASNAVGPTNGGVISFNGGTLQYTSNFNSDNSARFSTANNQQVKIDTNGQQVTFATGLNSNGGSLTKLGSGNLTLVSTNTYTGATTINAGTLIVGDGGTNGTIDATSSIVDNGTLIFNHSGPVVLAKVISGTGNLTQAGTGSLKLTATNTYTGATTINAGTLIIGDGTTNGSIANTSGIVDNGTLIFDRSDALTQAGAITGTGHVTQNGTGSVTLTGTNTYGGLTTINNGTLVVGDGGTNGSISNTTGIVDNGTLVFNRSDSNTLSKIISGSGNLSQNGSGVLTLTATNTYSGITTVNNGSLVIGDGGTNGSIANSSNIVDNANLSFNRSDDITLNKVISGTGHVTKSGIGNLTLTATNTYTGATTINAGTLIVGDGGTNGSIATTSAIVDNGTLIFNRADPVVLAKAISGTGNLTQAGSGSLQLTATNTYTGATNIASGTLIIGDGATNGSIANTSGIVVMR